MAHFAEIDVNSVVQRVIVVSDNDCNGGNDEEAGKAFIASLGLQGTWVQTSYNTVGNVHYTRQPSGDVPDGKTPFRKNFGQVGFVYDATRDAFIPPKPDPSWVLDEDTCLWVEAQK